MQCIEKNSLLTNLKKEVETHCSDWSIYSYTPSVIKGRRKREKNKEYILFVSIIIIKNITIIKSLCDRFQQRLLVILVYTYEIINISYSRAIKYKKDSFYSLIEPVSFP